jgi:hypothetical protein
MNTLEPDGRICAADECGDASPARTWNIVDSVFLYKQGLWINLSGNSVSNLGRGVRNFGISRTRA